MKQKKCAESGFTLVEIMIAMVILSFVLIITAVAFKTVLGKTRVTYGSEESSVEGLVGLEMLRHDLQQTGFGLFTDEQTIPTYGEAAGKPHSDFNDAGEVPRPLVTGNNVDYGNNATVLAGTDFLVIKAVTVLRAAAAQKWTYINDSGVPKKWGANDFTDGTDKLIALIRMGDKWRLLQMAADNYAFTYYASGDFKDKDGAVTDVYKPATGKMHYLYGLTTGGANFAVRAPFNRTDYYIRRPDNDMPASCSPAAGILYKTTLNHGDGLFSHIPIVDCVADMQIVLGWNTKESPDHSQEVDVLSSADGKMTSGGSLNGLTIPDIMKSAKDARRRLKMIKVYILAQDGIRDPGFVNTDNSMVVGDASLGETALTSTVDLTTPDKRNYRWKLFRILVKPKNL